MMHGNISSSVSELRLAWRFVAEGSQLAGWRGCGPIGASQKGVAAAAQHRYYPLRYITIYRSILRSRRNLVRFTASQLQTSGFNHGGKWQSLHGIFAPLLTRDETS